MIRYGSFIRSLQYFPSWRRHPGAKGKAQPLGEVDLVEVFEVPDYIYLQVPMYD